MRPSPSPPAVLRETAALIRKQQHAVWLQSEDLLALATTLGEKAQRLEEQAELLEDQEAASEWLGPTVVARRESAA
jgi:hypothetical protein